MPIKLSSGVLNSWFFLTNWISHWQGISQLQQTNISSWSRSHPLPSQGWKNPRIMLQPPSFIFGNMSLILWKLGDNHNYDDWLTNILHSSTIHQPQFNQPIETLKCIVFPCRCSELVYGSIFAGKASRWSGQTKCFAL